MPDPAVIQRDKLNELTEWRIDPSLIEFPDAREIDNGLSTVSRAFVAVTGNIRSSQTESGDDEGGLEPRGKNFLRKTVTVEKMKIEEKDNPVPILESALREAGILVELSHENVIELEGFVEDIANGLVWLIFPWQEYGNLKDFVALQDWEVPERISLMYDVSQGVEYLHYQNPPILHCDLKAFNVLVTSKCRAVITGFNGAQRSTKTDLNGKSEQETWGEAIAYTLRWAAPELLSDQGYGLWSDIWALGWIFYEVTTNSVPFGNIKDGKKVIYSIVVGKLPSITNDPRIWFVSGLGSLMVKCWSKDPNRRPTAEGCREWLEEMPRVIPDPLRFSKAVAPAKNSPSTDAGRSSRPVEAKIVEHHGVHGYGDRFQSSIQQPRTADPSYVPVYPAATLTGATEKDCPQVTVPPEADSDGSETVLQSILRDLNHLSIAPTQLTIRDSTEIGCGRYGEVLLATLKRPSQVSIRVAVKELRTVETRGVRKRIALRLARELRIWAEVCHLNILPLIGFYLSDNYEIARFISPLMINGNVSEYLERTQVGGLKRLDITNILINDAHQAVLCDFGLALFIQESGISSGLTTSRSVKGSLRYMSPELNLDDEAKHTLASDVWAWGCTAFEIMTDCVPYKRAAKDSTVLLAIAQKCPPGSVETFTCQDYLPQCWDFDAQNRPQVSRILHELFPNSIHSTSPST